MCGCGGAAYDGPMYNNSDNSTAHTELVNDRFYVEDTSIRSLFGIAYHHRLLTENARKNSIVACF